jgi:mono/diheme cytochrome c family protein
MSTSCVKSKQRLTAAATALLIGVAITSPTAAVDLENAKKIYVDKCLRCHGKNGRGDGPKAKELKKQPANYTDKKKMAAISDEKLKHEILDGTSPMPAYRGKLTDGEVDDLIAYIRTFAK